MSDRLVRVARIGRPHGIRGEVTVEVFTDSPELRFSEGYVLTVRGNVASELFPSLSIERARWNKNILILKFVEVSERNTAETLRDAALYAPSGDRDDNESWYAEDLMSFSVHRGRIDTEEIGKVTDLITGVAQDMLEVQLPDGKKVFIPFVEELVPEIDGEKRALVITPPDGLLELNQE